MRCSHLAPLLLVALLAPTAAHPQTDPAGHADPAARAALAQGWRHRDLHEDPLADPLGQAPPMLPDEAQLVGVQRLEDGRHLVELDWALERDSLRPIDLQRLSLSALETLDEAGVQSGGVIIAARDADGTLRGLPWFTEHPPLPPRPGEGEHRGEAPLPPRPGSALFSASWPRSPGAVPEGALSGRTVYLSQCHGWLRYESLNRWSTQRGNYLETVEDLHNPEGADQFLIPYLLRAGAQVIPIRDMGPDSPLVIVDNDEPASGYSESDPAAFGTSVREGRGPLPLPLDEDSQPMSAGTGRYMFTVTGSPDAVAQFVPALPESGWYPVYATWSQDGSRAPDAHYVIRHAGGVSHRYVDQTRHGGIWFYLGSWYFEAGSDPDHAAVELWNDSSSTEPDTNVIADSVRFGVGEGLQARQGITSGRPRWEEAGVLATQFNGAPPSVYDTWGCDDAEDDGTDLGNCDPGSRSRFAAWDNEAGADSVYLSWHSNACGYCGARGTSTYVYGSGGPGTDPDFSGTSGSWELGGLVQDELVASFQDRWDPSWQDRGLRTAWFAEVNPSYNPEMPAALVELAFHDTDEDVELLKEPAFRQDASRAMYRGIVRYFAERDGVPAQFAPEPPVSLSVVSGGPDQLTVRWSAGPAGAPLGDAPTHYRVATSTDGLGFDDGVEVFGTSWTSDPLPPFALRCFQVSAVNAGGQSFASETVCGAASPEGTLPLLLVSGFDRRDGSTLVPEPDSPIGSLDRMDLGHINHYGYQADHGRALAAWGVPFGSATNEAVIEGAVDLADYQAVDWFTGNESTIDRSFDLAEQAALADFRDRGGALLVSGSEIGWHLSRTWADDAAANQAFLADVLSAELWADSSEVWSISGAPAGPLAAFGGGPFDAIGAVSYRVGWPDVFGPLGDAEAALLYGDDPDSPAALHHENSWGSRLLLLGFPFETLESEDDRHELMGLALDWLLPDWTPPSGDDDDDDDDDDDTGDDDDDTGDDDDDSGDDDDDSGDDDDDSAGDDDDDPVGDPPWSVDPDSRQRQDGCSCSQPRDPNTGRRQGAGGALALALALLGLRRRRSPGALRGDL